MEKLKKYLKEDINQEEFDKDIKELQESAVKDYFVGLTKSQASKLLEDIPSLKSAHDSLTNKAVDSFRDNTLPGMLEEKVNEKMKELNPPETPEQKRIRELEDKIKQGDLERNKEKMTNYAYSLANKLKTEKGIDMTDRQIKLRVGNTEEKTAKAFEEFEEDYSVPIKAAIEAEIAKRFKGTPPKGGDPTKTKLEDYTEEQLQNIPFEQRKKMIEDQRKRLDLKE